MCAAFQILVRDKVWVELSHGGFSPLLVVLLRRLSHKSQHTVATRRDLKLVDGRSHKDLAFFDDVVVYMSAWL